LTTYEGRNAVVGLLRDINRKIEDARRAQAFYERIAKLNARYPQIPAELLEELRNHDWYFEFSDDIRVYRNGKQHKDHLLAKLKEINAEGYYHEYLKL
jgi:NAD-dependent DNA ligase